MGILVLNIWKKITYEKRIGAYIDILGFHVAVDCRW